MTRADLIVSGDYVLSMTDGAGVLNDAAVAVADGRILDIGPKADIEARFSADRNIGGKGKAVIPGLVNTHCHAPMVYFRGLADDLSLMDWLQKHIWPAENRWMSAEFVRDATELACLEMLRAGITAFSDMYFFQDEVGEVAQSMGMRATLCAGVIDFPTATTTGPDDCIEKAQALIGRWKGRERIRTGIGAHSVFTCSPDTLGKIRDAALKHDALVHIHLSETEFEVAEIMKNHTMRPVKLLDDIGLLDARTHAAHCVWLDEEEIDILARRNVSVAHCVKSNLKLASGIAPIPRMLERSVKVTLGTDGAASNNRLDVLDEMSTAARLHKAASGDATVVKAETALLMATCWGAEAIGFDECGVLEPGRAADLVVVGLEGAHLAPVHNIVSHLVYAAHCGDVESVVIDGKMVLHNGSVLNADEGGILEKSRHWGAKIAKANHG